MRSNIKEALEELSKTDIYSIILFALWKIKENPEYAVLSELSYIMDNDSLIRFLKYYGGKTITIPTVDEFRNIINALILYAEVNLEGNEYSQVIKEFEDEGRLEEIKKDFTKISEILDKYDFRRS